MLNCLIVGGAGFIGSNIAIALVERGHRVRVFDLPNISTHNLKYVADAVEVLHGDMNNECDVLQAVEDMDVIVHLAYTSLPGPSNQNPAYDIETNLVSTIKLLELAMRKGTKKIVFASSGGTVYGFPQILPIPETHPTNPICAYGISKLAVEKYLALFNHLHGLSYTVLRIGNPYGERQRTDHIQGAIAVFLGKALSGETITVWGDGSIARDYMYIGDLVSAFTHVIETDTQSPIYNIAGGCAYTLKDILSVIGQVTGRTLSIKFTAGRKLDVPINCLDINLAKNELNWEPRFTLEEGIDRFWNWLKKDMRSSECGILYENISSWHYDQQLAS